MRRLARWLILLALLVLAVPVLLFALLATESGSAWVLRQSVDLARPLGIELAFERSGGSLLRRLEIEGLHVTVQGNQVAVGRLLLHWRPLALADRMLHVRALEISDVRVLSAVPAETEPAPAEIPDLVLPLALRLDRLVVERLELVQGDAVQLVEHLSLAASLDRQGLVVRELRLAVPGARLEGRMGMQALAPHALDGELSLALDRTLAGDELGALSATAVLGGQALQPAFDLTLTAPAQLRLHGSLRLDQLQPGFDLAAEWSELRWPLREQAMAVSRNGRLTVSGLASDYRLDLRAGLQGEGLPDSEIMLLAQGDERGMRLEPLDLATLGGRLTVNGDVSWDGGTRWTLEVTGEEIDPGVYLPEWPGRLGARISSSGSLAAEAGAQPVSTSTIHELSGQLRGQAVSARGALEYRAGRLQARALQLASGPNRINIDGQVDERLAISFDIDAPELGGLYPGLAGRLEGTGRVEGTQQAPAVVARLSGKALAFEGASAQDLGLELDWREDGGRGQLRLAGVQAEGVQVTRLSADLQGTPGLHDLKLSVDAETFTVALAAQGGVQGQSWLGELKRLDLSQSDLGAWRMSAPTRLTLGAEAARSDLLCLTQAALEVCAEGGWASAGGLDLAARLNNLDLARFAPYLPGEAIIEGRLDADLKVGGTVARPSAEFELRPGDGLIRVEGTDEPMEIAYRNARVNGRFENDRGTADLRFDLGARGHAKGRLTLGPEQAGQRALGGEIDADFPDLSLVSGFVPVLEQVEGHVHLDVDLAGTLTAPRVLGGLEISDARARLPAAGITLSDIGLTVRGDGDRPLRVQGQMLSGEGRIALDGTVDVGVPGGPVVDLTLKGADFEVARLPEARVAVSPDLRLEGGGPYHLSGKLLIPLATIEIEEVPSGTVGVSDDEIVVGEETAETAPRGSQALTARVRVELGEAVTFKGFGLTTGLTGVLDATTGARGPSVDGKIELLDGRYKSYGQDLTVERGRLLFAGPPDNPDIDLRAVRASYDGKVKAYLSARGPLSKPRLRVFSEPALPEAEALAYLLTGRGPDQAGQEEGGQIAAAALSMGLSTGDPVLQDLRSRLGLDDLRIEGGDSGFEETSLILGKYLNPDLYIGYSQGLFNPAGAVLVRLRLSERIEVESRSGIEQSVDLYYRLEHD